MFIYADGSYIAAYNCVALGFTVQYTFNPPAPVRTRLYFFGDAMAGTEELLITSSGFLEN
jgi:hypothetical protein